MLDREFQVPVVQGSLPASYAVAGSRSQPGAGGTRINNAQFACAGTAA
jgi:hypothetical protein